VTLLRDEIFKGCDIRGRFGREINESTFRVLGRAMGRLARGRNVIVGGDVRISTPALKRAFIHGLVETGARPVDLGIAPTPAIYFAKRTTGAYGVCIVTASHNPPEDNGLKLMMGDEPAADDLVGRLRGLAYEEAARIEDGHAAVIDRRGSDSTPEDEGALDVSAVTPLVPKYTEWLASCFGAVMGAARRLRVAVDAGNGCMSEPAPALLGRLGFDVVELFCRADGSFPNRAPNPAVAENLVQLSRCVTENSCDCGVAYDGDGDRIAFVAEDGRAFTPEEASVVLIRGLPVAADDKVVYDLKNANVVAREVERLGGRALVEKSGHSYIKTRMIGERALFGCEISGHYFFRHLDGGDDALYATCVFLGILQSGRKKASELRDSVPESFITPDIRLEVSPGRWEEVAVAAGGAFPPESVKCLDGIRVEFADGWGLARPSITEPMITFRFEGDSPEALRSVVARFCAGIGEIGTEVECAVRSLCGDRI